MTARTPISRALLAVLAVALCAPFTACKTPLERAWGLSEHAHLAQSIANPDAGLRNRETPRPDGQSTANALTKLRTQEAKVPKAATGEQTIINVGK
jgi:hypothetical protein